MAFTMPQEYGNCDTLGTVYSLNIKNLTKITYCKSNYAVHVHVVLLGCCLVLHQEGMGTKSAQAPPWLWGSSS